MGVVWVLADRMSMWAEVIRSTFSLAHETLPHSCRWAIAFGRVYLPLLFPSGSSLCRRFPYAETLCSTTCEHCITQNSSDPSTLLVPYFNSGYLSHSLSSCSMFKIDCINHVLLKPKSKTYVTFLFCHWKQRTPRLQKMADHETEDIRESEFLCGRSFTKHQLDIDWEGN